MAITYKITKVRNPKGDESKTYCHAVAVKTNDYAFDELAEDIAQSTTVTKADAVAVLTSMKPFIQRALLNGRRVVLQDLGALVMSMSGKCYPQEALADEEFVPASMIKGYRIRFQPEAKLKKSVIPNVKLKRVSSDLMP